MTEWDDEHGDVVLITGVELTEPYRELLAKGLVANVTKEIELIRKAATQTERGPSEPPSGAGCSISLETGWDRGTTLEHP